MELAERARTNGAACSRALDTFTSFGVANGRTLAHLSGAHKKAGERNAISLAKNSGCVSAILSEAVWRVSFLARLNA